MSATKIAGVLVLILFAYAVLPNQPTRTMFSPPAKLETTQTKKG